LLRVLYIGKYALSPPPLLGYQPRYLKEIDYMRREKERKGERKRLKNMMDAKKTGENARTKVSAAMYLCVQFCETNTTSQIENLNTYLRITTLISLLQGTCTRDVKYFIFTPHRNRMTFPWRANVIHKVGTILHLCKL
jgi:hypothetical protein